MCSRFLKEKWRKESLSREEKVIHVRWIYSSGWVEIPHPWERTTWNDSMDWHEADGWAEAGTLILAPYVLRDEPMTVRTGIVLFFFNVFWGKSTSLVKSMSNSESLKADPALALWANSKTEIKFSNIETSFSPVDASHTHSLHFCQQVGGI